MVSVILIPIIGSFILMVSENLTDSVSLLFVINSHLGLGTGVFQKRMTSTSKAKKATKTVKEAVKEVPVAYPVKTPNITPSEPNKGLFSRLLTSTTGIGNTVKNSLDTSQTTSSYRSLCKTCTTLKTNIKNFFWSLLVFSRVDRYLSPKVLFFTSLMWSAFKWIMRGFTLFNLIMFAWIFYFNTPIVTAQLLTGWLLDFFSMLKITYTDTVARFLDYLISVADNGLKSVPKHPETPVEYPEGGFYKQYREIFKMIQDLPPRPDYSNGIKSRWYDFLRDGEQIQPIKYFDPEPEKTETSKSFSFIRDNWQYFAVFGGVVAAGGLVIYFWSPISTGIVTIGSAIKTGVVATGSAIKAGFDYICGYFPTFGKSGDPDGVVPLGPTLPNDEGNFPLTEMTPRNTAGPKPLTESEVLERALRLKLPDSPTHEPSSFGHLTPQSVVNLTSPEQSSVPLPSQSVSPNLGFRQYWGYLGELRANRLADEAQTRLGVSEMIRTLREHNLPVPDLPARDLVGLPGNYSSSSSSTSSALGLSTYFHEVPQSVVENPALSQGDPLGVQSVIQNSPVLSQANLEPEFFAPSSGGIVDFPSSSRSFQGGFNSPRG